MWVQELKNGKFKFTERYYDHHNKQKFVSVTLKTGSQQSHKKATQILNQKIEDRLNQPGDDYQELTFNELSKQWLEIKEQSVKSSTITNYQNHLTQINKVIGCQQINNLTAGTINRMFLKMLKSGNSYKTVHERYKIVRNIIRHAVEYDHLDTDTITGKLKVEKMNLAKERDNHFLEVEEAEKLFDRMIEADQEELADFFKLQMQTGMRYGELASLHIGDIDLNKQTIFIRYTYDRPNKKFTLPKSNKTRSIYINDETVKLIKKIKRRRNLLLMAYGIRNNNLLFFNAQGEPLSHPVSINILHRFETKDKPLTTHIFRHTFVTRMMENNVASHLIAEHVGWSDTQMLKVYAHFSDQMDRDLKEAITSISI